MEIYLPVAQMSVSWVLLLGLGMAIGILSGMRESVADFCSPRF